MGACPVAAPPPPPPASLRVVSWDQLQVGRKLGDGASGEVFAATLDGQHVALKIFRCAACLHLFGVRTEANAIVVWRLCGMRARVGCMQIWRWGVSAEVGGQEGTCRIQNTYSADSADSCTIFSIHASFYTSYK